MNAWRLGYGFGLLAVVLFPLAAPLGELLAPKVWHWTADDASRLYHLTINTLILCAGSVAVALPAGTLLAVLLFRTSFVGRSWAIFSLALVLFVPLPIIVSSWQITFGQHGLMPFWLDAEGRPWTSGMGAAIWIHAVAAVPWVAFLVGMGLSWIEPELEDEAAQIVGPWRVLALVTLPRVRASLLGAALFVALQVAGETSVTEMMLVPTLAEEMRTQFAVNDAAFGRTLVLALPSLLIAWVLVLGAIVYLEKNLPPMLPAFRGHRALDLGSNGSRFLGTMILIAILLLPLGSLVWRVGLMGYPPQWDAGVAAHFLRAETRVLGGDLVASLLTSAATGGVVAVVALIGCWLARDHVWIRWLLFAVTTWAWILPGPAVGMALKKAIDVLPDGPWVAVLYHGPSPAPLMWAQGLRALPIAVVFLWPVVRMIPRELFEEARLGGAGALSELLHIVLPTTRQATLLTALAAAALCLGEVGAGARVETPGWQSFASTLLMRMHYGVDNNVSALCLMMLAALVVAAAIITLGARVQYSSSARKASGVR